MSGLNRSQVNAQPILALLWNLILRNQAKNTHQFDWSISLPKNFACGTCCGIVPNKSLMALILLVHLVSPTWLHYVLYVVYYLTCLRFEFFRTRLRHCLRQWGFQQGRLHVHPRSESRLLQRGQNNLRQSMDHDFIAFFCYFVRSYWFIENVETRDIIYLKKV